MNSYSVLSSRRDLGGSLIARFKLIITKNFGLSKMKKLARDYNSAPFTLFRVAPRLSVRLPATALFPVITSRDNVDIFANVGESTSGLN